MTALVETRHKLSAADRATEAAFHAAMVQRAATSPGMTREGYDAMIAATPLAAGVAFERVDDGGVRGWWVRPADAPRDRAILFVHGGAYLLGSAEAYRGFVSQLAARAGVAAFSLDYPLAPEQPFPAAHDAAVAARGWLAGQGVAQVALVGDSAGAALVLSTLSHAAPVASVVAFSPWVDLAFTGASFNDPAQFDPIFKPAILAAAAKTYLAGADPTDGRASPLYDVPAVVPPLLVQVGTDELLLDDARRYAARAAERGGEVRLEVYDGLHHVFQREVDRLDAARHACDAAAAFMTAHWAG